MYFKKIAFRSRMVKLDSSQHFRNVDLELLSFCTAQQQTDMLQGWLSAHAAPPAPVNRI